MVEEVAVPQKGDPPPLRQQTPPDLEVPPPRQKQPSRPEPQLSRVEVDWTDEPPTMPQTPQSLKSSPPSGIKLESRWGKVTIPQVALAAILAAFGGAGVGAKVVAGRAADTSSEGLEEMRLLRAEVAEVRKDVRAVRKGQIEAADADDTILAYTERMFIPIVASLRRLDVKLEFDGPDRAKDVEFHAPPLNGPPRIQPKAALPKKPSL